MNALFNAINNKEFKKISSNETAKEAWIILQTTYEGTKAIKDLKLQRLTTSFEEIKMEKDKSFDEFFAKLKDIANSAFNLRETIPEPKIMRKVLRSLLKRYYAKITVIEESKDIDKIPLTELVGNLQTYELGLTRIGKSSKSKSMALKAKSSDINESSNDEDSTMSPTSLGNSRSSWRMPMQRASTRTVGNPIPHSSRPKIKGKKMLGMAVSTRFP